MTVKDTKAMIAGMTPRLTDGVWVYCCEIDMAKAKARVHDAFAMIHEAEGMTLILPYDVAAAHGYNCSLRMRRITLDVFSDLEGIGLTAAVAQALTDAAISCNVVAAFHHDHVLVPEADSERAIEVLMMAQKAAE
ncbi:ACT domain-containing protein [Tateyamaria sp.]|uniref:ACT domain-containing protein n=1 Tax=Tateyamaria sp. TaxID=1929288 RepID=UPI00329CEB1D